MGNVQPIIDKQNDNQKLEYLISKGLLNDEVIQLYRNGDLSLKDIHKNIYG